MMSNTNDVEAVERGFASSADAVPCWYAIADSKRTSYLLRCVCGITKWIFPDKDGECEYAHVAHCCGWVVRLKLKDFDLLTMGTKERRKLGR